RCWHCSRLWGRRRNPCAAASRGSAGRSGPTAPGHKARSKACSSVLPCSRIGYTRSTSRSGRSTAIAHSPAMPHPADIAVIGGGGGVAGMAAAAAIHQLGYQVLLVEPGLNDERRLAGEVFHPPGVAGLAELGLLPAVMSTPAVTVNGFSVSS